MESRDHIDKRITSTGLGLFPPTGNRSMSCVGAPGCQRRPCAISYLSVPRTATMCVWDAPPQHSKLNTRPQPCVEFLGICSQRTRLCNGANAKLQTCLQNPKPTPHLNRNLKQVPKVKTKPTSKPDHELNRNLSRCRKSKLNPHLNRSNPKPKVGAQSQNQTHM
jgi:hypothetical protein